MIVEWGEECNAESPIRHGIQQTMARRCQEEIHPEGEPAKGGQAAAKPNDHNNTCQKSAEEKRMRESPVSPKVAVPDAKPESDDIQIGNYGAKRPDDPDALRGSSTVEKRPDA